MKTAHDGGKVVSLTYRPPLPSGNPPGTDFCYRLNRPQGHSAIGRILCEEKIPLTPAAIETATFRFVVQHLNYCASAVPLTCKRLSKKTEILSFDSHLCFRLQTEGTLTDGPLRLSCSVSLGTLGECFSDIQ